MRYRHCLLGEKNWNYKGYWTTRSKVFMRSWVPDQIEIWKCWFLSRKITGVPAVKPSWNKSENQQQTKLNPQENSPHGQTGGRRALAPMDKSGLHNVSGLINCKWTWTSSTKHVLNFLREIREREKIAASRLSSREAIFTRARVFFSRPTFPRKNAGTERGNAQSSPWDMWISSKLFLDQFNPCINRKFFFSGEVRKPLFSVVEREFNSRH